MRHPRIVLKLVSCTLDDVPSQNHVRTRFVQFGGRAIPESYYNLFHTIWETRHPRIILELVSRNLRDAPSQNHVRTRFTQSGRRAILESC
jgi:hypothetical protein